MNPDLKTREIQEIPGVGGPFIETTDGCWVQLTYGPNFQWANKTKLPIALYSVFLLSTGTVLGWVGHAVILS